MDFVFNLFGLSWAAYPTCLSLSCFGLSLMKKVPKEAQLLLDHFGLASDVQLEKREIHIVPVNVTYSPFRTGDNLIRKMASNLVEEIPDRVIGSVTNPRVWARVTTEAGTSAMAYCLFVEHVLNTYDAVANPALHRTLIHDNLSSHRAPEVYEAVHDRGHRVVCRPPYRPQDGPVEYAINQVCVQLNKRWTEARDLESMRTVVEDIIENDINNVDETFVHCGYIWN